MRTIAISFGAVALALAGSTYANPIMVINDVYVEQFPATSHVQITRTYSSYPGISTTVSRDGTTVEVAFETFSAGSRDLGSGMSQLTTQVGCDCSVPLGHRTYVFASHNVELDVLPPSAATHAAREPSAKCHLKCASGGSGAEGTAGAAGASSSSFAGATAISSGGITAIGGATVNAGTTSVGNGGAIVTGGTTAIAIGGTTAIAIGGTTANATTAQVSNGGSIATVGSVAQSTSVLHANGGSIATGGSTAAATSASVPIQNGDSDSSGCAISRTAAGLTPIGVLAALGLLVLRRRK